MLEEAYEAVTRIQNPTDAELEALAIIEEAFIAEVAYGNDPGGEGEAAGDRPAG